MKSLELTNTQKEIETVLAGFKIILSEQDERPLSWEALKSTPWFNKLLSAVEGRAHLKFTGIKLSQEGQKFANAHFKGFYEIEDGFIIAPRVTLTYDYDALTECQIEHLSTNITTLYLHVKTLCETFCPSMASLAYKISEMQELERLDLRMFAPNNPKEVSMLLGFLTSLVQRGYLARLVAVFVSDNSLKNYAELNTAIQARWQKDAPGITPLHHQQSHDLCDVLPVKEVELSPEEQRKMRNVPWGWS